MPVFPFLHPPSPTQFKDFQEVTAYVRRLWESLQAMRRGKIECVTELTLTPDSDTTTLADLRLSPQSVVVFDPKTANAAAELYGGTMYVLTADRDNGAWVISHANNSQADRVFQTAIVG